MSPTCQTARPAFGPASSPSWTLGALSLALVFATAACCCPTNPEVKKKQSAAIGAHYNRVVAVSKKVPKTAKLRLKKCPDEKIRSLIKARDRDRGVNQLGGRIVEYKRLRKLTSKKTKRIGKDKDFGFLTSSFVEDLARHRRGKRTKTDTLSLSHYVGKPAYRHLAVLRAKSSKSRVAPKLENKPPRDKGVAGIPSRHHRTAKADRDFTPGRFEGWVFVFDLMTGDVICQAPISVRSSKTLPYKHSGKFSKDPEDVIRDDFKDRFKTAFQGSVEKMSEALTFSIY